MLITGNNEKTYYTVNSCCSAAGEYMPPYILFKAKSNRFVYSWVNDGPNGALYNTSPSGWMEVDQFNAWFNEFVNFVSKCSELNWANYFIFGRPFKTYINVCH